jgi:MFS family permease
VLPAAIAWLTAFYPPEQRAKPIALANTCFYAGSIIATQIVGLALPTLGWFGAIVTLGIVVAGVCAIVARRLPPLSSIKSGKTA